MRGRGDGDGCLGPVEAAGAACGVDGREAFGEEGCAQRRGVEHDRPAILRGHLAGDAASYHVARGELGARMDVLHEAAAVGVEEHGAIAADGFGNEECTGCCQRCGMELIELQVGELRARAQGHGDAIARGYAGVGGVEIELACAAAGQNDGVGVDVVTLALGSR